MINRANYLDVQAFLSFQLEIKQCDKKTVRSLWSRLRHLLEWADDKRFTDAYKIRPTLPAYLGNLKKADGSNLIGASYFGTVCKTVRAFFTWSCAEYRAQYKRIDQNWVLSIRPPKARSEQSELKKREIWELDEIIKLANYQADTLMLKRVQASAVFLFLSGMRIGAFVSLPARCVDLGNMTVSQLPELGVNTKNHKAAITTLLNIPELLDIVRRWDTLIREEGAEDVLWYAHFTQHGEIAQTNPSLERIKTRQHDFIDDLKKLCELASVEYKSPHKIRHGHVVYALKLAKNMEQLKAISQNVMHSTVGITDGIYGNLVHDDVHATIASLANVKPEKDTDQQLINKVISLLQSQLKPETN